MTWSGEVVERSDGPNASTSVAHERSARYLIAVIRDEFRINRGGLSRPGFHAMVVYRFGAWLLAQSGPARWIGDVVYRVLHVAIRSVYGIEIPRVTQIGRGVRVAHQGGIVVHGGSHIGAGCFIRHNVTIGAAGSKREGAPWIGPRTEIGVGAVVVGPVTIGADVRIGPNAVVMSDVPDGCSVFAPPARVLKIDGPPTG